MRSVRERLSHRKRRGEKDGGWLGWGKTAQQVDVGGGWEEYRNEKLRSLSEPALQAAMLRLTMISCGMLCCHQVAYSISEAQLLGVCLSSCGFRVDVFPGVGGSMAVLRTDVGEARKRGHVPWCCTGCLVASAAVILPTVVSGYRLTVRDVLPAALHGECYQRQPALHAELGDGRTYKSKVQNEATPTSKRDPLRLAWRQFKPNNRLSQLSTHVLLPSCPRPSLRSSNRCCRVPYFMSLVACKH